MFKFRKATLIDDGRLEMDENEKIAEILRRANTVAVIGAKESGAAHSIPVFIQNSGYRIIPVNPKFSELFGETCYSRVNEVDEAVDVVNIFRRSEAVIEHVGEILDMSPLPEAVWMQLGIENSEARGRLEREGLDVVEDRCMKIEYQRVFSGNED